MLPSLFAEFFLDDYPTVLNNPYIKNADSIFVFFTDWRRYTADHDLLFHRGLVSLTYYLNQLGIGPVAFLYRIGNIFLHLATGLALVGLFKELFPERKNLAWLAGAVFLLLPGGIQISTYVTSRTESLVLLTGSISLTYLLKYYRSIRKKQTPKFHYLAISYLFFLGAFYSKLTYVALLPVLFILPITVFDRRKMSDALVIAPFFIVGLNYNLYFISLYRFIPHSAQIPVRIALFALFVLFYWILINLPRWGRRQITVFSSLIGFSILFILVVFTYTNPDGGIFRMLRSVSEQLSLFPYFLSKLVFAYDLSFIHDQSIQISGGINLVRIFVGLIAWVAIVLGSIRVFRMDKRYFLVVFAGVVPVLLYHFIPLLLSFNENRLYYPGFFLAIGIALAADYFAKQTKIIYLLLAAVFVFNLVNATAYAFSLTDITQKFVELKRQYPDSALIALNAAFYQRKQGYPPVTILSDIDDLLEKNKNATRSTKYRKKYEYEIGYLRLELLGEIGAVSELEKATNQMNTQFPMYPDVFVPLLVKMKQDGDSRNVGIYAQNIIENIGYSEKILRVAAENGLASGHAPAVLMVLRFWEDRHRFKTPGLLRVYGLALASVGRKKEAIDKLQEAKNRYAEFRDEKEVSILNDLISRVEQMPEEAILPEIPTYYDGTMESFTRERLRVKSLRE